MIEVLILLAAVFLIIRMGFKLQMNKALEILKKYEHLQPLLQEACEKRIKFCFWGKDMKRWAAGHSLSNCLRRSPIALKLFWGLNWIVVFYPQKVIFITVDENNNILPEDPGMQVFILAHEFAHIETALVMREATKGIYCRIFLVFRQCLFVEMVANEKAFEILARHKYDPLLISKVRKWVKESTRAQCEKCVENLDKCPLETKIMKLKQATGLL